MAKRQKEAHCDVYGASGSIYVWADDLVIEQVREMPAVLRLEPSVPGAHTATVDPRYNIDQVAGDIHVLANRGRRADVPGWLFKVMRAQ